MHYIKTKVIHLLETYQTNEPEELADALGITLLYQDLEDLQGYYLNADQKQFIIVNANLDYYDQRVVIGHELGHALLHPELNETFMHFSTHMNVDKYERQANEFAAHLLLPDDFEKDEEFEGMSVEQISQTTGLPLSLLKLKLNYTI